MKHSTLLSIILVLLLILMNTRHTYSEDTQIEVSKHTVFKYTIDIFNNTISCKCNVRISVKNNLNRKINVTIVTLERFHRGTLNVVEGEQPHDIIENNDFSILIWETAITEKSYWYVSIEYLPNISIPVEIGLKMRYEGPSTAHLDRDKYLLTGVRAKGTVILDLLLINTREEYAITSYGERVVLPLIATLSLSHPKDLCIVMDNEPEANYTHVQRDYGIHSWIVVLQHRMRIRQEIFIRKLTAWHSLWLPPISIDLIDDPWKIRAQLEATEIEKMYKNLKNMLNETTNTYEKMREIRDRLEAIERGLSTSLIEYRKVLNNFTESIENFERKIEDVERLVKYYHDNIKHRIASIEGQLEELINTLELIEDITSELNITTRGVSEAIEVARSLHGILSDIEQAFEEGFEYIKSNLDTVRNLLYTSKIAARRLLSALEAMGSVVSDMVNMVNKEMDKIRKRLRDLKHEFMEIEKLYEKYTILMELAERKIDEYMNSINVTTRSEELEISKKISVKYNIGIKLPLMVAEIKTTTHTIAKEVPKKETLAYLNLLMLIPLLGVIALVFHKLFTRCRKYEKLSPEIEELFMRLNKIEEYIKKNIKRTISEY